MKRKKPDPRQGDLFDHHRPAAPVPDRVVTETRRALKQVEENASDQWKVEALAAVERTCRLLQEFICDDVWRIGNLESTREDRALGPIMLQAQRMRLCVKTNTVRPSRRSHLSGKPVWRSLIFGA